MAMLDQGRRRVVGVAVLGVVVLVVVGLLVPVARGLLEDEPVAPVAPAPVPTGGGPWERLPRPPANDVLQGPDPPSALWTGEELILGSSAFSPPSAMRPPEALAYDPHRRRWRVLPAPPLQSGEAGGGAPPPAFLSEGGLPEPVWTGTELVVWSTTTDQAGRSAGNTASAYNPYTGRWRTLPPAPITPRRLAATVWAGDRLLVWGGIRNLRGDRAIFIGGANLGDRPRMDRGTIPDITEQGAAWRPR